MRKAIDVAKMKSKHSEFYYRLQTLNDKIFVFRNVYYDKMPNFQRVFLERKKKELELKLARQKKMFEYEMSQIEKKIKRRMQSTNDVVTFSFGQSNSAEKKASPARKMTTIAAL